MVRDYSESDKGFVCLQIAVQLGIDIHDDTVEACRLQGSKGKELLVDRI